MGYGFHFTANKAFTLVELMIVVAIVALLGSYGVPAYQDYIRKTRVAEAIALVSGVKTQIADNAYNGRPLTEAINVPKLTPYLSSIYVDPALGSITLHFNPAKFNSNAYSVSLVPKDTNNGAWLDNLHGTATDSQIPTGGIAWGCRSAATTDYTPTTMPAQYVPEACKGKAYQ